MRNILTVMSLLLMVWQPSNTFASDTLQKLKDNIASGVELRVHGAYDPLNLYVLSYWNPKNFFDRYDFPAYSFNVDLKKLKLTRHDKLFIKGQFVSKDNRPDHIRISEIKIIEKFKAAKPEAKKRQFDFSQFKKAGTMDFKIHAIAKKLLVVEAGDVVLPMYFKNWQTEFKTMSRNDTVRMSYRLQKSPKSPPHLVLDESQKIKTLKSIMGIHGKKANLDGCLVKFPKSPQIKFDIFALAVKDQWQIERNYTLVNFQDFKLFTDLRTKLAKLWDHKKFNSQAEFKRSRFINCSIKLRVSGEFNVVSPAQANPQILIDNLNQISVLSP